jgi:hypothetical protein
MSFLFTVVGTCNGEPLFAHVRVKHPSEAMDAAVEAVHGNDYPKRIDRQMLAVFPGWIEPYEIGDKDLSHLEDYDTVFPLKPLSYFASFFGYKKVKSRRV